MKVTILGCGGSPGTPSIDGGWGECDPDNPKNRRLRPSVLVEDGDTAILIDTSPDLRQQLLSVGVTRLDAVLYTHYHADHLHGIDDLRPVNRAMNGPLDVYADRETLAVISERFGYVFEPLADNAPVIYKPLLVPKTITPGDTFQIGGLDVSVFEQDHGYCKTMGFRVGLFAYCTDVVELPEAAFDVLEGIDLFIVGALVDHPHPTHAHVDKALGWIERVGPTRSVLTHLSGHLDYDELLNRLPGGVEPAFDGMVIEMGG